MQLFNAWFNAVLSVAASFLLTAIAAAEPAPKEFETANQLYDLGKFAEARQVYEALVKSGNYGANLFYNLGNADFRLGDLGQAALNFERALALDPGHPEARANLAFVRDKGGSKTEALTWREHLFPRAAASAYAVIGAIAGWVALFCLVAAIFRRNGSGRRSARLSAVIALLVCGYAVAAIFHSEKDESLAIVIATQAQARFAPADNSTLADNLPVGSRVRILQDRGPWVYCELPNSQRGWIAADSVERVRLHSS